MANGKEPKEHDLPKPSTPLQYPFGEGRSTPSKKDIRKKKKILEKKSDKKTTKATARTEKSKV